MPPPDAITESKLLQLDIGDIFYDVDMGNTAKFVLTKCAERNAADLGWKFEGKLIELNGKEPEDNTITPFFLSDGAGFDYCTISLKPENENDQSYDKNEYIRKRTPD